MKEYKINKKAKILKKTHKYPCRECDIDGVRGIPTPRKQCKRCHGTGIWKDNIFYFIITDKNGNQIALDGDTLK